MGLLRNGRLTTRTTPPPSTVSVPSRASSVEFPERIGQPVCQSYMRTGVCKFGSSCKYHHPRQQGLDSNGPVPLNYYAYPYSPEEKECSCYKKRGYCKFGETTGPFLIGGFAIKSTTLYFQNNKGTAESLQREGYLRTTGRSTTMEMTESVWSTKPSQGKFRAWSNITALTKKRRSSFKWKPVVSMIDQHGEEILNLAFLS